MSAVNISDLRVKIFITYRSSKQNTSPVTRPKIRMIAEGQLFLETPVDARTVDSISQITIYFYVHGSWRPYHILNISADPEQVDQEKIDQLTFQLGENERIGFNRDLFQATSFQNKKTA